MNWTQSLNILDAVPEAYVRFDSEFRYTLVNRAAEQLLGKARADLLGKVFWEMYPEHVGTSFEGNYRRVMAERVPVTFEDSSEPWQRRYAITAAPDSDDGIVVRTVDITERKRAEERLLESEERFHSLFENASLGYQSLDEGGHFLEVNQTWLDTFGYSREEVLGKWFGAFLGPEFVPAFRERFPQFKAAGKIHSEFQMLHKSGERLSIAFEGRIGRTPDGGFKQTHCILLDITERKKVEDALRASEAKFRDLFDSAPVAYHELDQDGVIRRVNRAECALLGYAAADMLGRPVWEFVVEAEQAASREAVRRKLSGEQPREPVQRRFVRCDGSELWVEIHDILVRHETGETAGIRAALLDITKRKRTEEAMRESELQYRILADSGQALIWTSRLDKKCDYFNQPWLDFTGRSLEQELGDGWTESVHPEDLERCIEIYTRAFDRRESFSMDYRMRRHDGEFRWIQDDGTPRYDSQGKFLGYIGHCLDITERKRAEEELRQRNVFVETLLENSPIGFAVNTIAEGRPVFVSRKFANIYGVAQDSVRGVADFFERVYVDPVFREKIRERIMADMATGDATRMRWEDIPLTTQAGEHKVVTATNIPLPEQDLMISTVQDVTARKLLEAQFHQAQKMESVGRLAGGVAHDFNNLLTVINGYSQMLLSDLKAGDPLRDSIEEIHKAGERAAGLTRQLLAFSRKQILEPRRLSVNLLVEEMRPMLERLVGEDVEVRVALHPEGGTIHADPHQLEQVVMNLVVNARDAMPGGGKLLVETANVERAESYTQSHLQARVGRYVMLAVSDTGVGMDEETKNRIFEPFFTTKGVGKGTGLGLSMVQGIVAQSGGYVEVYSEKGRGTTFKIYLPALAEAGAGDWRPVAVTVLGGKETVLVVEDQAEVRKYAVAVLKAKGYRVIPAETAGEALLLCEREGIDLVLTDVVMPTLNGRELANRLEKLRPGIKVLFMSGYTDNVIEQHGVLEEGAEFIQKPFSPEELAGKIRAILGPPTPEARILVANDEAGVRGFLRKVLEQAGYEVIEAADGKQALQQARTGHTDLVITDLIMPEQEGIETIQALRREVPGIGIIAISGAFGGQFLKTAKMLGADAVLSKPVSADLLLARVVEVLKSRR